MWQITLLTLVEVDAILDDADVISDESSASGFTFLGGASEMSTTLSCCKERSSLMCGAESADPGTL